MTYWPGDNADLFGIELNEYEEMRKKRCNMNVWPIPPSLFLLFTYMGRLKVSIFCMFSWCLPQPIKFQLE